MPTADSWIPSGHTTTEMYLLPGRRFLTALPATFRSQVDLLRTALSKLGITEYFSHQRSAAAVGTGPGGLALAGAGTEDRTDWCDRRRFATWQEYLIQPSHSRAAGKFRSAALMIIW